MGEGVEQKGWRGMEKRAEERTTITRMMKVMIDAVPIQLQDIGCQGLAFFAVRTLVLRTIPQGILQYPSQSQLGSQKRRGGEGSESR